MSSLNESGDHFWQKLEKASSSLKVFAIQLLFLVTFGLPGVAKLLAGGVPPWFAKAFGETFLAVFPGLFLSFYSIVLIEVSIAALVVLSLVRREFYPGKAAHALKAALVVSLVAFVQLGFGKRLIQDHDGAASLFLYFVGTLVCLIAIDKNKT